MRLVLGFLALGCPALAAAAGPAWAAPRCEGAGDDRPALLASIDAALQAGRAGSVVLPAGRCMMSGPVTVRLAGNQVLSIFGQGPSATELVFPGGTDGIVVSYASAASASRDAATGAVLHLVGIGVVAAGRGRDGIRIEGDSDNAHGTVEPDTILDQVMVRGESAGGWDTGLVLQDVANSALHQVGVLCAGWTDPAAANGVGLALQTTGQRYATRHTLTDFAETGCGTGLQIGERVQGVAVSGGNFTGGQTGIGWASGGRQEALSVVNSQFSTLRFGISVNNVQNVQVTNSVFYNQNSYLPQKGTWAAIALAEVDNSQITGNGIMGVAGGSEYGITLTNDRAVVAPDRPTTITGNTFFNLFGPALYAANDTANVLFSGNAMDAVLAAPPVALQPGTDVSFAGNRFGGVLFAVGYPGSAGFTLSMPGGVPVGTHWPVRPDGLPPGGLWVDGAGVLRVLR